MGEMFIFECKCKSYIDISCDSLFCNVSSLSRPRASEFWERIEGGEASTGTWQFERVDLKLIGAIKSEQPVLAIKLPE